MAFPPPLAVPANLYKNDDLVRRRLNPEPKSLRWSLRQECIEQVKLTLLQWARNPTEKRSTNSSKLNAQEPEKPRPPVPYSFQHCPTNILQDIYMSVTNDESNSNVLKGIIEVLLVNGLSHVDLECVKDLSYNELKNIFYLMESNGRIMKSLRLVGRWIYSPSAVKVTEGILSNCTNLQHCTLQESTDVELLCLARNCPQLIKLEVLHPSLNQRHLEAFYETAEQEELQIRHSLKNVSLPSSMNGQAIHLMLETFPDVVDMSCIHLEAFMHELDLKQQQTSSFKNSSQSISKTPELGREKVNIHQVNWVERCSRFRAVKVTQVMGRESLDLLTVLFPNLEHVHLKTQEIMNLRELVKLQKLKSLNLENSQVIPSSYTQDVLPLLQLIGSRLTHLGLAHFDVVELPKTHNFCPNLSSLDLQHFTLLGCTTDRLHRLQYCDPKNPKPFKQLRRLRLRSRPGKFISSEACEMLLSNSKLLSVVELHEAYGLNDGLAARLAEVNGFESLLNIRLKGVHGLTRSGIEILLGRSRRLHYCHVP